MGRPPASPDPMGMHCSRSATDGMQCLPVPHHLDTFLHTRGRTLAKDGRLSKMDNMYAFCRDAKVVFNPKASIMELMKGVDKELPRTVKKRVLKPIVADLRPPPPRTPTPAPDSPRTIAHRVFLRERAQRQARERVDESKKLPWAQHRLGLKRWEMAQLVDPSHTAYSWLMDWQSRQPTEEEEQKEEERRQSLALSLGLQ